MAKKHRPDTQMPLPGISALDVGGKRICVKNRRIPHKEILTTLLGPADDPNNLVGIYTRKVLPVRTRTIQLLGRKSPAKILRTLLGYEVQGAYKRIQCPDVVTARYLKMFMEIGCRSIKLPYDPTVTTALLPELEKALARIASTIRGMFSGAPEMQTYVLRHVYVHLRQQLKSTDH